MRGGPAAGSRQPSAGRHRDHPHTATTGSASTPLAANAARQSEPLTLRPAQRGFLLCQEATASTVLTGAFFYRVNGQRDLPVGGQLVSLWADR